MPFQKKPALPQPDSRLFGSRVKECLETMMGRRAGRVAIVSGLDAEEVTSTPTAAQYNALRTDVDRLRSRLNLLLQQLEDA